MLVRAVYQHVFVGFKLFFFRESPQQNECELPTYVNISRNEFHVERVFFSW